MSPGISTFEERLKHRVADFINSWSVDDVYDRFGSAGTGAQEQLECRLIRSRSAFVAIEARAVVGLLDYVHVHGTIHIGIVVGARFRRLAIGTQLVHALLHANAARHTVIAECQSHNHSAVSLLRRCDFELVCTERSEMIWRSA